MKILNIVKCSSISLVLASSLSAEGLKFSKPKKLDIPFKKLEATSFIDYDGDGVTDIIGGNYTGNILFRKNTGSNAEPKYAEAVKLKNRGRVIRLTHW